MHAMVWRGQATVLVGVFVLTVPAGGGLAAHTLLEQRGDPQGAKPGKPAVAVVASGCVRDVSDLGGQGGGGAPWQGSISGHVLTDVRMGAINAVDSKTPGGSKPSNAPDAASAQGAGDPAALSMFLIRGISETELRRYREHQVEVQGTIGPRREVSRGGAGGSGRPSGSTPNGRVADEPKSPAVGTGGSIRVPSSSAPGVTQVPPEFQATSIRVLARSCPAVTP